MVYREVPLATVPCPGCRKPVAQGTEVCPACHSPIDEIRYARMVLTLEPLLKRARRWLAIAAGIDFAWFLFACLMGSTSYSGIPRSAFGGLVFAVFFLAAWALARRWPLGAPLTVASIYGIFEVAGLTRSGPVSLLSGIVVKILMLSALIRGIVAGFEIRSLRGAARPRDRALLAGLIIGVAVLGILLGLAMGPTTRIESSVGEILAPGTGSRSA
jgi:hypothetical protein